MGLETDGGTAATDMTGAAGGNDGFDMAGAVDSIGSDLFGGSNDDGSADLGNDTQPGAERDGGAQSPAPSPAPTAAPAASPAPTAAPAAGPATPPAAPGPVDLTKPPPTWRAEAQAEWAKLSPTTQAEIHKREQDMWKGIEGYKNEATFSKAVKQVLAPVAERLAGRGVGPLDFLQALSGAHLQLSDQSVPVAQRTVTAIQMLKSYGIEVSAPGAASAPAGAPEYVDPQVAGLQQELAELKSRLNGQDQQRAQTVRQQLSNDLNAFAADPAHPYFDEVADDIVLLIRANPQIPLKEAYEKAVRMNPTTFAKESERIATEALAKKAKEEKERADAARKASGANVTTSGHRAAPTASKGSMDDTMQATLANIKAREKS
jgi:hypothetical protein